MVNVCVGGQCIICESLDVFITAILGRLLQVVWLQDVVLLLPNVVCYATSLNTCGLVTLVSMSDSL